jgi:hypothetical protein
METPHNMNRDPCYYIQLTSPDVHEGTPKGSFQTVNSIRTYVSVSDSDSQSQSSSEAQAKAKTTVVFLSDIFGVDLVNTQLVADEWAQAGFKVLLPDFFEGDAIPHEHLKVSQNALG